MFLSLADGDDAVASHEEWGIAFGLMMRQAASWHEVMHATERNLRERFDRLFASKLIYLDAKDVLTYSSWKRLWHIVPGLSLVVSAVQLHACCPVQHFVTIIVMSRLLLVCESKDQCSHTCVPPHVALASAVLRLL